MVTGKWKLNKADQEKTAFCTPFGLFQFKVMPFGLTNAPSTFQSLMELVLRGLHWSTCLVYLDDIIVYSSTIDEHFTRLRESFWATSKGWTENQAVKMFPIQEEH